MKNKFSRLHSEIRELMGCVSVKEIMSNAVLVHAFGEAQRLLTKARKERHCMTGSLEREVRRLIAAISNMELEQNPTLKNYIRTIEAILLQMKIQSSVQKTK
ncbi:MAG: hypothetical protein JST16_02835 [Bdellovibrionales bacterium]|nr:hypothetical protein [Bdellovibrionales bacterium]